MIRLGMNGDFSAVPGNVHILRSSTDAPVYSLSQVRLPSLTLIAYGRCEIEGRGAIDVENWNMRRRCEDLWGHETRDIFCFVPL
jgi:hypothetical protein